MATRFYLPASGTAPLGSLAVNANWELTDNLERRPCDIIKSNTSLTQKSAAWTATATQQWCWIQFQSKRLAAGYSWTTSDTVSMVIKAAESVPQVDSHLAYVVRVVSGDGLTIRGVIGLYHATSAEYPTSLATIATRIHDARTDGASNFSSQAGDRIIIEIGHHGVTPTTGTCYHNYGDPTAVQDQILVAGETTDYCPWVELSQTVSFDLTTSCHAYIKGISSLQTAQQAVYMVGANPSYPASTSTPAYIQGETYSLNTLKDDFDDNILDTNKWTKTQVGAILSEANQRIQVDLEVGFNSALLASRVYYDLTDGSAIVEAWNVESTDGYAMLILYNSMTNDVYIGLDSDSGEYYTLFGANIDGSPSGSVLPYDAVNHRWWKIRHIDATNRFEFYLSADGINWGSSVYSISASIFPLDCVLVKLDVGNYGGGLSRIVYLDNFNILKAKGNTPAYIVGGIIPTPAQQSAYIQGAVPSTSGSTFTPAYVSGIASDLSNTPAYIQGQASDLTSAPAYLLGGAGYGETAQAAYLQGLDFGVSSIHAYIAGQSEDESNQPAFIHGQESVSGSYSGYIRGQDEAETVQTAFIQGQTSDLSNTPALIVGGINTDTAQSAYIEGYVEGTPVNTYLHVFMSSVGYMATQQAAYICGGIPVSASTPSFLSGVAHEITQLSSYILGSDFADTGQSAFMQGSSVESAEISAFIAGGLIESTAQAAYIKGEGRAVSQTPAYICGYSANATATPAFIRGQDSADSSTPAYLAGGIQDLTSCHAFISGIGYAASQLSVYIEGGEGGSATYQHAYIAGQDSSLVAQSAYICGSLSIEGVAHAYLSGIGVTQTSQHVYIAGFSHASSSFPAYMQGKLDILDSQDAYIRGSNQALSNQGVYIRGQELALAATPAYIEGIPPVYVIGTQHAYMRGIAPTINFMLKDIAITRVVEKTVTVSRDVEKGLTVNRVVNKEVVT